MKAPKEDLRVKQKTFNFQGSTQSQIGQVACCQDVCGEVTYFLKGTSGHFGTQREKYGAWCLLWSMENA